MSEYVVRGDDSVLTVRSTKRPPFEPKGWQRAQRDELRQALRLLQPRPGALLTATYASPDDARADLENVLLYNVGPGAFSRLLARGVACRRIRSYDAFHHMRYELGQEASAEVEAAPSSLWRLRPGPGRPRQPGRLGGIACGPVRCSSERTRTTWTASP